jgi:solute carrier family 39 (zinc transporter), member 1/2/3
MTLLELKWISASLILILSLSAGFASLQFSQRLKNWIQLGDSFANGIFVGAALFHLIPHAIHDLVILRVKAPYWKIAGIVYTALMILWLLDRFVSRFDPKTSLLLSAWLIVSTLSVHAFIAGITLGLSDTMAIASIMFIAIVSHKAFEIFALVMSLKKRLQSTQAILIIFILFAFVTPLGIWSGTFVETLTEPYFDYIITATFSAIAAGTFLYIGLIHGHRLNQIRSDSHQQYTNVLTTLLGIAIMGIIGFWV